MGLRIVGMRERIWRKEFQQWHGMEEVHRNR